MDAVADLLEISVGQLWTIIAVGAVLAVGWYILKAIVRTTARVFAVGCVVILIVIAALAAVFVLT
jgi:hypothetical protein